MSELDYYIRIEQIHSDNFNDFCKRHSIRYSYCFEVSSSLSTELYRAFMSAQDATTLKLSIPVNIMEKFNG
jgi:hypothetical protein